MNNGFKDQAGAYMADVHVASSRASLFALAVAAGWLTFPFAL